MTITPDSNEDPSASSLRVLQDAFGAASAVLARRMGMNSTDALAIEYISLSTSPLSPGELGERLAITRSSTTEVVDRLVAAGHIERVRDDSDRRRFMLLPTEHAKARVREELGPLIAGLNAATEEFTHHERNVISSYLGKVIAAYQSFAARAQEPTG
ncbi:MarR family winged helix-turn-helix transcriptional regulator [Arthrobacter alpinus]|uniref:MarR family winged helix-turn-helix transcriptional regulator n=1 Tax=Arthrobacter alpinus TaxID=656366 RepID=UPI0012FF3545|nr:MarR family winged helix-turn-helix transcriptional regulator [Arthrobacter alpinus]